MNKKKQGEELTKPQEKEKNRKMLNVPAGKSILASDVETIVETERKEKEAKRLAKKEGKTNGNNKKRKANKSQRRHESEEEDTDNSEVFSLQDYDYSLNLMDFIQDDEKCFQDSLCTISKTNKINNSLQKKPADDCVDSQQPSTSTSD